MKDAEILRAFCCESWRVEAQRYAERFFKDAEFFESLLMQRDRRFIVFYFQSEIKKVRKALLIEKPPTDILSLTFEVPEYPEGIIEGPKKRRRKISSI